MFKHTAVCVSRLVMSDSLRPHGPHGPHVTYCDRPGLPALVLLTHGTGAQHFWSVHNFSE